MKKQIKTLGLMLSLMIAAPSFAQQESISPNEVIGKFAPLGYIGPRAGEKTMSEAHVTCLSETPNGATSFGNNNRGTESDFYTAYKECMKVYVPFRGEGQGEAGSCSVSGVTWGQCSASVPALANGQTATLRHEGSDKFEGNATFRCEEGTVKFQTGGCSTVADSCEAGQSVYWGVTFPLWADDDPSTIHLDKYGLPRHTPKASCGAEMGEARSGELVVAQATVPETSPADRYNVGAAQSPQRCFNNEFIREPGSGVETCEYIPRDCSATVYNHPNGCSFNIPALSHDQIFNSSNPLPENSVGALEAYCWDGDVEIKAATCQPSCEPTIAAYQWDADYLPNLLGSSEPRQCGHSEIVQAARIAPSTDLRIDNETDGLIGEAVYTCESGVLGLTSENCKPQNCEGIPSNSWGESEVCSHENIDTTLLHGEQYVIKQGTPFVGTSEIAYSCDHGTISVDYAICNPEPQCVDALDEDCFCEKSDTPPNTTDPEVCGDGAIKLTRDGNETVCCKSTPLGLECSI